MVTGRRNSPCILLGEFGAGEEAARGMSTTRVEIGVRRLGEESFSVLMAEGIKTVKPFCSTSPLITSEYDDDHGADRTSDTSQPCPNSQVGQGNIPAPGTKPQAESSQENPVPSTKIGAPQDASSSDVETK